VTVLGKRLLVANDVKGVVVFDLEDPAHPVRAR